MNKEPEIAWNELKEAEKRYERAARNYKKALAYYNVLGKRNPDKEGVWEVIGENQTPDGRAYEPRLGKFRGKLGKVILHALTLRDFGAYVGYGRVVEAKEETVTEII